MTTPIKLPSVSAAAVLDSNSANNDMLDATVQSQQPPQDAMNSNNSHMNQYRLLEDLVKLISLPPSKDHLIKLSSNVMITNIQNIISSSSSAGSIALQRQQHDIATPSSSSSLSSSENLVIAYLRAVAHHLQVLVYVPLDSSSQQPVLTTGFHNFNINIDDCSYTILPVITACIAQLSSINCSSDDRASIISDTGILESLWYLVDHYDSNAVTNFACEFLQACILCHQYSFALQHIAHKWPVPQKPKSTISASVTATCSVDTVLRYYYLRGIVCMGCCDKTTTASLNSMAIRCFWTCLTIPTKSGANTVSSIAVATYKKLVLLQALSPLGILHTTMIQINSDGRQKGVEDTNNTNDNSSTSVIMPSTGSGMSSGMPSITIPSATNPLSTPKEMSWDLLRYITQANPPTLVSSSSSHMTAPTPQQINTTAGHNIESSYVGSMNTEKSTSPRNRYTYPHFGIHVYQQMIHAFVAIDRKKFNYVMNEYSELFHTDGNYGYVSRLSNALYYRQVYVISRSYASLPLRQLCLEMNSLPIDHARLLLQKLQENLSWSVKIITISSTEGNESEEVVLFPSDLPRPIMSPKADESMMGPQHQMIELSQKMQEVNAMIESSSKYKTALTYYDHQQKNQKSTKNNKASLGTTSMVLDDSFSNF